MKFRGVNHLAMVTNDMEKTVRFYRDVLGMPLVGAVGNTPGGYPYRHYFFETGPNSTIAFFEWPGMVEEFHKPAGQPASGRLQFDHVSFDVETEDELLELQDRLEKAGVEVPKAPSKSGPVRGQGARTASLHEGPSASGNGPAAARAAPHRCAANVAPISPLSTG